MVVLCLFVGVTYSRDLSVLMASVVSCIIVSTMFRHAIRDYLGRGGGEGVAGAPALITAQTAPSGCYYGYSLCLTVSLWTNFARAPRSLPPCV